MAWKGLGTGGQEKANGPETGAVYSLSCNDLLGDFFHNNGRAGEFLTSGHKFCGRDRFLYF
jgi:hypothetical protein